MPTAEEIIARLPLEQQQFIRQQIQQRTEFERLKREEGSLLFNTTNFARGLGHGLTNSLYGLATLPIAVTNYVGLTDADFARRNLVGAGGILDGDNPRNYGNAYGLGNLGGFVGSLAIPGLGVAGAVAKTAKGGQALAKATAGQRAFRAITGPEQALMGRLGIPLRPATFPGRAARGATEFSLMTLARTPGNVEERVSHAAHSAVPGAVFGIAGRLRGIRLRPTQPGAAGELVIGAKAEKILREAGGTRAALEKGILDPVAPFEPLGPYNLGVRNAGQRGMGFYPSNMGRGFLAGLATPGMSPMEVTGNPFLDSALFNAGFFGALGVTQKIPRVAGRRAAQENAAAEAEAAARRMQSTQSAQQQVLFPELRPGERVDPATGEVIGVDQMRQVSRNIRDRHGKVVGFEAVQPKLDFGEPAPTARPRDPFTGRYMRTPRQQGFEKLGDETRPPNEVDPLKVGVDSPQTPNPEAPYISTPFGPQRRFMDGEIVMGMDGVTRGRVRGLNQDGTYAVEVGPDQIVNAKANEIRSAPEQQMSFGPGDRQALAAESLAEAPQSIRQVDPKTQELRARMAGPNGERIAGADEALSQLLKINDDLIAPDLDPALPAGSSRSINDLVGVAVGTDAKSPRELSKTKTGRFFQATITDDLNTIRSSAFPDRNLEVRVTDGGSAFAMARADARTGAPKEPGGRRAVIHDPATNTLWINPSYWALPKWQRQTTLIHELTHHRQIFSRLKDVGVKTMAALYSRAGFPTRAIGRPIGELRATRNAKGEVVLESMGRDHPDRIVERDLAQEVLDRAFRGQGFNFVGFYAAVPGGLIRGPRTWSFRLLSGADGIEGAPHAYEIPAAQREGLMAYMNSPGRGLTNRWVVGVRKDGTPVFVPVKRFNASDFAPAGQGSLFNLYHEAGYISMVPDSQWLLFGRSRRDHVPGSMNWPKIAGRDYAWSTPHEFTAEMAAEQAVRGPEGLERRIPGSTDLLRTLYPDRHAAYVQGVTNLADNIRQRDVQGQGTLFGPQEITGPPRNRSVRIGSERVPFTLDDLFANKLDGNVRQALKDEAEGTPVRKFSLDFLMQDESGPKARWKITRAMALGGSAVLKKAGIQIGKLKESTIKNEQVRNLEGTIEKGEEFGLLAQEFWEGVTNEALTLLQAADQQGYIPKDVTPAGMYNKFAGIVRRLVRDKADTPPPAGGQPGQAGLQAHMRMPGDGSSLAVALDRAFANGLDGLVSAVPNARTREVILRRYGGWIGEDGKPLFANADGTPMHTEAPLSIPKIAKAMGISTTAVENHINRFVDRMTEHQEVPAGNLIEFPKLQRNLAGIQEVLPKGVDATDLVLDSPVFDPALQTTRTKVKEFKFRSRPGREDARVRAPKVVETRDAAGNVTKVEHFTRADPKSTKVVPAETLFVHGERTLGRQASLWQSREFAKSVAADERAAGIEPSPSIDPPTPSTTESAAHSAAAAAGTVDAFVKRRRTEGLRGQRQKDFSEFVPSRESGFPTRQRKTPIFTQPKSHVELYFEARRRLHTEGLDDPHFQALPEDKQLEHAIWRQSTAPSEKRWVATIRKYAGVAKKHAGKFFGRRYPTYRKIAEEAKVTRRGLNRATLDQILREAAAETGVEIEGVPRPSEGRAMLRLRETDTGITHDVVDMGTAALILDARAQRLQKAPNLEPPGFDFVKITFPKGTGGGGPRLPKGPDRAGDGEHNGIPPSEEINRAENQFVWTSRIKPMIDVMADVANAVGDFDLVRAGNALRTGYQVARNQANIYSGRMEKIAKKNAVKKKRAIAIGEAAAEADRMAWELQQTQGEFAAENWVRNKMDDFLRSKGLEANEIAFLRDMRVLWDELFAQFGIGFDKYIYGYFARYRPGTIKDTGTLLRGGDLSAQREFAHYYERSGELSGAELNYFDVFNAYARTGFRFKELGTTPGSMQPSTWEFTLQVMERYGVTERGRVGGPEWMEPLKRAFLRSQGEIDPGIHRSQIKARDRVERAIGRRQKLLDALDNWDLPMKEKVRSAIERNIEDLGIKLERRDLVTYVDLFISLNRARTFGLHAMRSIRHLTQSWFFTLPRVGPKAFSQAIGEMLDPAKLDKVYAEAYRHGVIKQAFFDEYATHRSRFLRFTEKLSFMYEKLDIWERTLSFRAQQIRSEAAQKRFTERTHMSFDEKWDLFKRESGLELLNPAFEVLVRDHYRRGNYVEGNVAHARLLTDHVLFDYTRVNAPLWATGSVYGRLFGQYGRWPLSAVETMVGMAKYGSYAGRARVLSTYAGVSAAVYGMGQAFGVRTADWIPFIHSISYSGGPGLSLAIDLQTLLGGNPMAQDEFLHNWKKDPTAMLLGLPFKMGLPTGDVLEALAAEMNLSRRQRRLYGIPRRSYDTHEIVARLMGFRPLTDMPKHEKLLIAAVEPVFHPFAARIRELAGTDDLYHD